MVNMTFCFAHRKFLCKNSQILEISCKICHIKKAFVLQRLWLAASACAKKIDHPPEHDAQVMS